MLYRKATEEEKRYTHSPNKQTDICRKKRLKAVESSKRVSDGDRRRWKGGKTDTHKRNVGVEEMEMEATDSDRPHSNRQTQTQRQIKPLSIFHL